ncbi:MAG: hypothetical protein M1822_009605 [Bathelium mastoideum]|nr:MAG: hypothetical protein M1822_009605 [Bathelium mastoideum]
MLYEVDASRIAFDIDYCLAESQSHGTFATFGIVQQDINPGLTIDKVGSIGLPLSEREARVIIDASRKAPFGKGSKTIVDESVRKTTEKIPGMFGTLVVCLPSKHEGGELCLSHDNKNKTFKTAPSSELGISYLAWYADVTHEVKTVTSGYRTVLTYNLAKTNLASKYIPTASALSTPEDSIRQILRAWDSQGTANEAAPKFLCYCLEHLYTESSLSLKALKGVNLCRAQTVFEACKTSGFSFFLATLEKEVLGSCEDDYDSWDSRDGSDLLSYEEDYHSLIEELDSTWRIGNVVDAEGELKFQKIEIADDNIVQSDLHTAREPDEESFAGYTGNEGATSTHWYRDSAIVIVPNAQYTQFMVQGKLDSEDDISSEIGQLRDHLISSGDNNELVRNTLIHTCKSVLDGHERNYTGRSYRGCKSSRWACSLELGVIAESCVVLRNAKMLQRCVDAMDDSPSKTIFWNMGKMMFWDLWPSIQESVEKAIERLPSFLDRMEAVEDFRMGFSKTDIWTPQERLCGATKKQTSDALIAWSKDMGEMALALGPVGTDDGLDLAQAAVCYGDQTLHNLIIPYAQKYCSDLPFVITFLCELQQLQQNDEAGTNPEDVMLSSGAFDRALRILFPKVATEFDPRALKSRSISLGTYYHGFTRPRCYGPSRKLVDIELVAKLYANAITQGHLEAGQKLLQKIEYSLPKMMPRDFDDVWFPFLQHLMRLLPDVSLSFSEPSIKSLFYQVFTEYLKQRVGPQPSKLVDWKRPQPVCRYDCSDCKELNFFLGHPVRQVERFTMNKEPREHLQEKINLDHALSSAVEKTNGPGYAHMLVVTKSLKSWESFLEAWNKRAKDVKQLFSSLDGKELREALGERYEEVMQMHVLKQQERPVAASTTDSSVPEANSSSEQGRSRVDRAIAPTLREMPNALQNRQQLSSMNKSLGTKNASSIPQKRKAEIVDLTEE